MKHLTLKCMIIIIINIIINHNQSLIWLSILLLSSSSLLQLIIIFIIIFILLLISTTVRHVYVHQCNNNYPSASNAGSLNSSAVSFRIAYRSKCAKLLSLKIDGWVIFGFTGHAYTNVNKTLVWLFDWSFDRISSFEHTHIDGCWQWVNRIDIHRRKFVDCQEDDSQMRYNHTARSTLAKVESNQNII